ncbi:MAG: hypothetical protein ABFQ89_03165 [Chloroflexota bacterium]
MSIRKANLLKFAASAYEMDLKVMQGVLRRCDNNTLMIGETDLCKVIQAYEGDEIVLVFGSLDVKSDPQVNTCRTCGRDYTGLECQHCRDTRLRLRGR